MLPHEWGLLLLGGALQVLVISTMLRGPIRIYPFVFSYVVLSLLSTVVQLAFKHYFGHTSKEFARAYWTSGFLISVLLLLIIIHLVRGAMAGHGHRNSVYWGLLLGVAVTGLGSLLLMRLHGRTFSLSLWMTEASRDYYFGAVILNAVLWAWLMKRSLENKRLLENKQLFLIVSGLGLQLSGAAIAHAMRLSGTLLAVADHLLVLSYLANLYVWYVALRRLPAPAAIETIPDEDKAADPPRTRKAFPRHPDKPRIPRPR